MSSDEKNYEWGFWPFYQDRGRGDTVEDCVREGLDWWRNYRRGTSPMHLFAVRERGAIEFKNSRRFAEWLQEYGLGWPPTPLVMADGSCGRCDPTVFVGHTQGDHWHCKCGTGFGCKSFRWYASPGYHIERACAECGEKIPATTERFIYGYTPHVKSLDVQFTLRCTRDAGGLWEYPVWLAKRVQAVKFALDLVDSPELTGQALKLAEMRQRVGEGWQYVHGIYGAHDPGIGSMSEGQLMEMHDMITSKDRSNRRAFNDYARSMGVDPRLGYSTSGG